MDINEKALTLIERAISGLAGAEPAHHTTHSSIAYTTVSVSHELKAISGADFIHYCERIRLIDARFLGIDTRASA